MLNSFYLGTPAGMVDQAAQFWRNQADDETRARLRRYNPSPEYVAYRKHEKAILAKILASCKKIGIEP